jgi:hypothetical protein
VKFLSTPDGRLGVVCILLAVFALVVWVPLDIDTGLVEKVRRRVSIGDSLLPVVALGFVILGGLMTIARSANQETPTVTIYNALFLIKIFGVLAGSLAVMRGLGPLVIDLAGEDTSYRALRDTAPWKYIGFVVGGSLMVMGLIALVERRLTTRGLLIGILTAIALVLIYDLPFEDLLLPPNGDV